MELNNTKYWWCKPSINPYLIKMMENVKSNLVFRQQETINIQEDNIQEDNIQKIQNTLTLNFDI